MNCCKVFSVSLTLSFLVGQRWIKKEKKSYPTAAYRCCNLDSLSPIGTSCMIRCDNFSSFLRGAMPSLRFLGRFLHLAPVVLVVLLVWQSRSTGTQVQTLCLLVGLRSFGIFGVDWTFTERF